MQNTKFSIRQILFLFFFILINSILLAYIEIQIEGSSGWAQNLPTWQVQYKDFIFTGYHLALWLFLFVYLHFIYFFLPWSAKQECLILVTFFTILCLEDAFWFLLNPDKIYQDDWRNPKIGIVPYFYFICLFLTLFFSFFLHSFSIYLLDFFFFGFILFSYPFQVACQ